MERPISETTSQVVGKGAKFSLYKPAEEMVYISLDAESRTKGKAAIDVVGAQTGKSVGSILQQVLMTCFYPHIYFFICFLALIVFFFFFSVSFYINKFCYI